MPCKYHQYFKKGFWIGYSCINIDKSYKQKRQVSPSKIYCF